MQCTREYGTIVCIEVCCTGNSLDRLAQEATGMVRQSSCLHPSMIDTLRLGGSRLLVRATRGPLMITRRCGFGRSSMHAHLLRLRLPTLCGLPEAIKQ